MIPIIIVNWNGYNDTIECIQSTLNTSDVQYHIHLIDNGSDNNEGQLLEKEYLHNPNVTVHLYDHNYGFTGAHLEIWDQVLSLQTYNYIALLNNDTTVEESWLSELLKTAEEKKCGIVSAKMIQYFDRTVMDNAGHKMLNTGEILPIGYGESIESYTQPFKNMGGCGGAVLYSTRMLRHIGFFDDHFTTGYEDAELGLRAIVSGYGCWFCPNSIVYHKGGQSIKKIFNEEYSTSIFTAILYSYFKNLSFIDIISNLPFLLFKYSCMLIIDIAFMRWSYLKIMLKSIKRTHDDRLLIRQKRRHVRRANNWITPKFKFFLWFDIKRFISIFIRNNRSSSLDNYG